MNNDHEQMLTIKSKFKNEKDGKYYYICDCACGNTDVVVRCDRWKSKETWHCGCMTKKKEISDDVKKKQLLTIKYYFTKNGKGYYMCDCACGNTDIEVRTDRYKSGETWHCGCQKIGIKKYIGQRFGRLVVNSISEVLPSGETIYNCTCDCGNTCTVRQSELRCGKTKSCGCLRKETAAEIGKEYCTIHGDKGTKLYNTWGCMKDRCNNPNNNHYQYYGGRGITVCDEWNCPEGYIQFKEDMYPSFLEAIEKYGLEGQEEKLSIDRIDVNKGYCKENCRWVTMKEQANNKTDNRYIDYYGHRYTAMELYENLVDPMLNLNYYDLINRLDAGWSLWDVMHVPNLNYAHCNSLQDYYYKFGKPLVQPIRFF